MANCLAVRLFICLLLFFFFYLYILFTSFLQPPIRALLKHDSDMFLLTQLVSSEPEEKWLRISFCDTADPIYFYILYNTVISVWTEDSSSVTLTWNPSSCMGLELLHVNGDPFYQICALF